MYLIASNLTTRSAKVEQIVRYAKTAGWDASSQPAGLLKELAGRCAASGADALEINVQQHYDQPEAMEFAVKAVQQATDLRLCLSSNIPEVLDAGLRLCKRPPILNYVSVNEIRLRNLFPAAAKYRASVILLVSDPSSPTDARDMLEKTAILVGAANEAGITNDRIMVDPGLIHVTSEPGQRHLAEIIEFLRSLPEAVDPPIGTTCWLTNSSTGAPASRRKTIETALLALLAGAGLSSVFLDILRPENQRTARLIKIFTNQLVYSDSEIDS